MSVAHLRNAIRRDTEQIVASLAQPRFATVTSVDPNTHSVRVTIQPEATLSGWIPDASAVSAGGGFGIVAPLGMGDQVLVVHPHGDTDHPVVVGRLFSSIDMPPVSSVTGKPVQPGEFGVFLPDGTFLHATGGAWNIKGNLVVDGDVTSTTGDVSDRHGSLDRLRGNYDGHDHRHGVGPTTRPDAE